MGTLLNQLPRKHFDFSSKDITEQISLMKEICIKTGISFDQLVKVYEVRNKQRELDLRWNDGDIKDEQLSGFGDLLGELNMLINRLIENDD